jgi:hypothetical protein
MNPEMVWEKKARPHPGLLPQGEGEMVAAPWQNDDDGSATVQGVNARILRGVLILACFCSNGEHEDDDEP